MESEGLLVFNNNNSVKREFTEKFRTCKDFVKFLDEYEELIQYIYDKYPSLGKDIEKDYWIHRIIKQHYEILLSLSEFLVDDEKNKFNEYMKRIHKRPFLYNLINEQL